MNILQSKIDEIKLKGYELDFSNVFNAAIENYKKIALNAGLAFLIFSIVAGTLTGGIIGGFFGFSSMTNILTNISAPETLSITSIFVLIFTILISALAAPFYGGILKMAHLANLNEEFSIATSFDYFKDSCLKELIIASVITSSIGVLFNALLNAVSIYLVGTFFVYTVSFFTFLTIPLIIFGNLKAIDAISTSIMLVTKNIGVLLGLLIVAVIMSCLGIIGFCIGIFFTLPFIFSVYYVIYINILEINEKSIIDEIGEFQE